MALDSRYIPFYNIAQFIFDKSNALPLTAGTVKFWVDEQRTTPKEVFRLTGISPNYTYTSLGATLTLGATGAFVDGSNTPIVIYAFPYDALGNIQRYYIEVFAEGSPTPQFVVEAAPYVFQTELPPDAILTGGNELNNSQFVEVSFNPQDTHMFTFTSAINEEVQLAPDWLLVASGTGSVTVSRIALTEINTPTNPPYVIDINSTGISTLALRQRMTNSPRLIAGGFVSGYFIAASEDSLQHSLQMEYNPSGGTLDNNIIIDATITSDGSYNVLQGNLQITGIISPDPATIGYVNIDTVIPIGAHLRLSSFQLVQVNAAVNIAYGQLSTPKQINTLFSSYKNSIQYMPKQSLTPWWKFGLNPLQLLFTGTYSGGTSAYIFDQTILNTPGSNSIIVNIGPTNQNGVLTLQAAASATDTRFALITYLAPQSCQSWWGYWLSSLARTQLVSSHGTSCRFKVRLLWRPTLPPTLSSSEPIASWGAVGTDPSFAAGWNVIIPLNDPAYDLSLGTPDDAGDNTFPAFAFDQMQLPVPSAASTNMFALVVYTIDNLNSTSGSEDYVAFDSISLVPNQFAVDNNPLTADEVKRACQYYYEISYKSAAAVGTATYDNSTTFWINSSPGVGAGNMKVSPEAFTVSYYEKWHVPTAVTLYSPLNGTSNEVAVTGYMVDGAAAENTASTSIAINSYFTFINTSTKASSLFAHPASGDVSLSPGGGDAVTTRGYLSYQFVCNALMGS